MNYTGTDYKSVGVGISCCFLAVIFLACVRLQTPRKNPSKEGKARSSSGVAGPEKDPVVSHRNCYQEEKLSCLPFKCNNQPEFVLTGGFFIKIQF